MGKLRSFTRFFFALTALVHVSTTAYLALAAHPPSPKLSAAVVRLVDSVTGYVRSLPNSLTRASR